MPEIMQLGPDDNDIDPYLTPCPADYPPCPLCGKHPDMLESGHIICCNILVDNPDAWFLLPRAIRWTHEPPVVAGEVYLAKGMNLIVFLVATVEDNGTLYAQLPDSTDKCPLSDFVEWAGPIPAPID